MARRKDDPLLQAAKGFPGRRKNAVEAEITAAAEAAAAQPTTTDNPFPVPEFFLKAPVYWAEAIKIWKDLQRCCEWPDVAGQVIAWR